MRSKLIAASLLLPLAACSDSTGSDSGSVAVRFRTSGSSAAVSGAGFSRSAAADAITLTGTNGTLVIDDIRLIVSKLELERAEDSCAGGGDDDDCEEFEGGPFLVDLPLGGGAVTLAEAAIEAGSYTEFEFEVEDVEADDDDDSAERGAMQAVLTQMRQAYPAFPSGASMVAHGTFNGQRFTVYFDAEVEVEQKFATPFRVPEDGALTVKLNPALWFRSGTQVTNLFLLNGKTVEFEAKFKSGIEGVDHDD